MAAVAAMAVPWSSRDPVIAIALTGMMLVSAIPIVLAPTGRRLDVASWVVALQPAIVVVYLYATLATAWCVLGHRPTPSLDDPKFIGPLVDVPYAMTMISLLVWPFSASFGLTLVWVSSRKRGCCLRSILALFAVWLASFLILILDPLDAFVWFMDYARNTVGLAALTPPYKSE